jgi:type I site-specific restriction-modification system R (restriction) subunit
MNEQVAEVKFQLAHFSPASGLNEELQRLYEANVFSVGRQLRYTERNDNSLDVVLLLNGLPILTAELKNPFTGQNVEHAICQYKFDRDPKERLFAFGRCLAHFAVDPDRVYVATHLDGPRTRFLPFNQRPREHARKRPVDFDHVVTDRLQEMVDTDVNFYKRVTDDRAFARFFVDWLFERFRKGLAE